MRDDNFNENVDSREAQKESRNQLNLAQRNEFINKFKNFLEVEECASLAHPVVAENLCFLDRTLILDLLGLASI
jgi:hypothetical protein